MTERPLAIVDIDGVVADVRHRLHHLDRRPKDWDGFFAAATSDQSHEKGVSLVRRLAADHDVVFLTGRPSWLEAGTSAWLAEHGLGGHRLIMRPDRDFRPAAAVKLEQLGELSRGRDVALVVDDDAIVIETMRAAGYHTLHATWEGRSESADAVLLDAQEAEGRT